MLSCSGAQGESRQVLPLSMTLAAGFFIDVLYQIKYVPFYAGEGILNFIQTFSVSAGDDDRVFLLHSCNGVPLQKIQG